jgi:hypothetical protein
VPHFEILQEFARALAADQLDDDRIHEAQLAMKQKFGEEEYLDACGVAAMFTSITKVVDLTGHKPNIKLRWAHRITAAVNAIGPSGLLVFVSSVVLFLVAARLYMG